MIIIIIIIFISKALFQKSVVRSAVQNKFIKMLFFLKDESSA